MTVDTDPLREAALKAFALPFGAVLKLAPDSGPPLWVDGRASPPQILQAQPDDGVENCFWRGSREALVRAMTGSRAFESAYVAGRVAIAGDLSIMARITLDESR